MLSEETFLDVWYSKVDFEGRAQEARETYSKAERKAALEAVAIEERHEELEVFLFSIVRSGCE